MRKNLNMLIVDDETSVARTLGMIFEDEGYKVALAHSCREALPLIRQNHYDIVITDLHMEEPDIGLKVVQEAQRKQPKPVTVIASGYPSMSNTREAMKLRVDYYALKPVELEDLLEAVRRLVGWRADVRGVGD